ncbi:MAG: hypothetical protein HY662_02945 [Chloroflexi bacterium]|nr:hypothetical protein [Chloroflexota bacterium]
MDILLRTIAILVELFILVLIFGSFLVGIWLIIFDLGVETKYKKFVTIMLVTVGAIVVVFLVSHLITFYPTIGTK